MVADDVEAALESHDGGEASAQAADFPGERGAFFGPFVEEVFLGGDAVAVGAAPLGPVAGVHFAAGPFGGGGGVLGEGGAGEDEEGGEGERGFADHGRLLGHVGCADDCKASGVRMERAPGGGEGGRGTKESKVERAGEIMTVQAVKLAGKRFVIVPEELTPTRAYGPAGHLKPCSGLVAVILMCPTRARWGPDLHLMAESVPAIATGFVPGGIPRYAAVAIVLPANDWKKVRGI